MDGDSTEAEPPIDAPVQQTLPAKDEPETCAAELDDQYSAEDTTDDKVVPETAAPESSAPYSAVAVPSSMESETPEEVGPEPDEGLADDEKEVATAEEEADVSSTVPEEGSARIQEAVSDSSYDIANGKAGYEAASSASDEQAVGTSSAYLEAPNPATVESLTVKTSAPADTEEPKEESLSPGYSADSESDLNVGTETPVFSPATIMKKSTEAARAAAKDVADIVDKANTASTTQSAEETEEVEGQEQDPEEAERVSNLVKMTSRVAMHESSEFDGRTWGFSPTQRTSQEENPIWVDAINAGLAANRLDLRLTDDQQKRPIILSFYDIVIPCGAMCSCALVDKAPEIDFSGAQAITDEGKELYTALMIDCDAIVPETLHWMVVDIENRDLGTGQTIQKYQAPKPLFGEHRYMIMLLQQRLEKSTVTSSPGTYGFDSTSFAKEHGLEPVAITWILVSRSYKNSLPEMPLQPDDGQSEPAGDDTSTSHAPVEKV